MWTELADALRDDSGELGQYIAGIHTATWRARVDPDAARGLVGAATALYATRNQLFDRGRPMPNDRVMVGAVEDCQIAVSELSTATTKLQVRIGNALDEAAQKLRQAVAAGRSAKNDAEKQTANADANAARDAIADCEMALEILMSVSARLIYAYGCLERVPEDLAEVYEAAYRHLSRPGSRLPADGDFLTATFAPKRSCHATA